MDGTDRPGWYELVTHDADAAEAFYRTVFGWTSTAPPGGGGAEHYRVLLHRGGGFGGIMPMAGGATTPFWLMYVAVADADAAVAAAVQDGARLHQRLDIPGVGRIAILTDPVGAGYAMIQPRPDGPGDCAAPAGSACAWHELHARDGAAGLAFYGRQFGWREVDTMDMGPMGKYRLFSPAGAGDDMAGMIGGAMTAAGGVPPHWELYFQVDAVDAALDRIRAAGGTVLDGPMEVPGGDWVANARDPQGAAFSIAAPRR